MDEDREMRLAALRGRIQRGEYQVEPLAVADAILRRWQLLADADPQKECSYPDNEESSGASRKATPGGPSATRPTQVSPAAPARLAAITPLARASIQMH